MSPKQAPIIDSRELQKGTFRKKSEDFNHHTSQEVATGRYTVIKKFLDGRPDQIQQSGLQRPVVVRLLSDSSSVTRVSYLVAELRQPLWREARVKAEDHRGNFFQTRLTKGRNNGLAAMNKTAPPEPVTPAGEPEFL